MADRKLNNALKEDRKRKAVGGEHREGKTWAGGLRLQSRGVSAAPLGINVSEQSIIFISTSVLDVSVSSRTHHVLADEQQARSVGGFP